MVSLLWVTYPFWNIKNLTPRNEAMLIHNSCSSP
jgi:hypothetical protein